MDLRIRAGACAVVLCLGTALSAQGGGPCHTYDASLDTPPDAQGWNMVVNLPDAVSFEVVDGLLHQSTLPLANPACSSPDQQQSLRWEITELFSFDDGIVFEAEFRIIASQYNINPCDGWPRPGFAMTLTDNGGSHFWLGFGESTIFLANDPYLQFGDPGIVEITFDTTDALHQYRLEVIGTTATLFIDDIEALTLTGLGPPVPGPNRISIGDPTSWANSEAEIASFSVATPACCPADLDGDQTVGVADLLALLAAWGDCADANDCPADFDNDNTVGVADLLELLSAWGPC